MTTLTNLRTPRRGKTEKGVSLRRLAKLASVDLSTVSRALNNDPRISPERVAEIRALASRFGYRPRPLRSKRTGAIGLIIASSRLDRPDEQFLDRIAWLVQQSLGERRLHVNIECVRRDAPAGQKMALPAVVQENRVDGVLVAGHPTVSLITRMRDLNVPIVAINDSLKRLGVSCVRSDPTAAVNDAILRLAAWGHRQFGLLIDRLDYPTAQARYAGYLAALESAHIKPDPSWIVTGLGIDIAGGRESVRELARRGPMPTALICCNDWMALGALQELQRQGLNVPNHVSLVGHDDLSFCEELEPKITSIRRSEDLIVAKAVGLLMEHIETGSSLEPTEQLVQGEVVWRQSTGAPNANRISDKQKE